MPFNSSLGATGLTSSTINSRMDHLTNTLVKKKSASMSPAVNSFGIRLTYIIKRSNFCYIFVFIFVAENLSSPQIDHAVAQKNGKSSSKKAHLNHDSIGQSSEIKSAPSTSQTQSLKLLLNDINDMINTLECESIGELYQVQYL